MSAKEWFGGIGVEDELERCHRLRFVARLVVLIVLLLAAMAWGLAHAGEVFRGFDDQGDPAFYRLSEKPCTDERVLAHLKDMVLDYRRFNAGALRWHGKDWSSCWVEIQGRVYSVDEEGEAFQVLPRALFKDESI